MTDPNLIERVEKALQSEGRLDDYHLCEIRRVDLQELLAALRDAEASRIEQAETLDLERKRKANLHLRLELLVAERDRLAAKLAEMRAENEKLWAVADAAQRFVGDVGCCESHELPVALSALPERVKREE